MTGWKQIVWKPIIAVVVLGALGLCAYVGLQFWAGSHIFDKTIVDHTPNWGSYSEFTISRYFAIPDEAEIVSATEMTMLFGGSDEVTFRLPRSKSPERWLFEIATESGLSRYRENRYLYDAGYFASERSGREGKNDTCLLEYTPSTGEYHAIQAWD